MGFRGSRDNLMILGPDGSRGRIRDRPGMDLAKGEAAHDRRAIEDAHHADRAGARGSDRRHGAADGPVGWAASPTAASSSPRASGSRGARSPLTAGRSTWPLHPREDVFAVLNKSEVFLADRRRRPGRRSSVRARRRDLRGLPRPGLVARGHAALRQHRRGATSRRSPTRTASSRPGRARRPARRRSKGNPVPGGMAITRDGTRLFVAAANRNAVAEVDLTTLAVRSRIPRRDPAVRAAALRRRAHACRQQLGRAAAQARRPDGQEPGPRHRRRRSRRTGLGHRQPDRPRRPARPGTSRSASIRRRSPSAAAAPSSPTR